MKALSVFSFQESHPVRVALVGGDPWFVALDIHETNIASDCRKIGLASPNLSPALRGEVPAVGTAMSVVAAAVSA